MQSPSNLNNLNFLWNDINILNCAKVFFLYHHQLKTMKTILGYLDQLICLPGHLMHLRQTSLILFLLCSKTVNGHLSGIGFSERIRSETPCEVYGKSLRQNHSTKRSVNFFPPEPWEWLIRWYLWGDITLWLIGHQHKPWSWYLP